jgi:SAM-dependent methyltransferase/methyltransferase-like protein
MEETESGGARETSLEAYDAVPYRGRAVSQTHPEVLGALAALHGLQPALPQTCRVLELGCAEGGNLLAMAGALPGASFVGVDGSARQIEDGERLRSAAGLSNVRLVHARFESFDGDGADFDYILCHGVFSWVPADVQDRLLALCRRRLAPHGLLFLSYNVYPGWHTRQMLREMLLFHVRAIEDRDERIREARGLVELLAKLAREERGTYRARLASMAESLADADDGYLFHEFLEDENHPLYLHQVARKASDAGLRYVASTTLIWEAFPPPEVEAALAPLQDRVVREQYFDFLSDRTFRRSIFCRDDDVPSDPPDLERAKALFATARARPRDSEPDVASDVPEEFVAGPEVRITSSRPFVKAAFAALHDAHPKSLSFDELRNEALRRRGNADPDASDEDLARLLARSFPAGLVRLSTRPSPCAWPPPERPLATAFARVQAKEGAAVTSLLHRTVEIGDLDRLILGACDGSRGAAELARVLADAVERGDFSIAGEDGSPVAEPARVAAAAREAVDAAILRLARLGMFLAPQPGD